MNCVGPGRQSDKIVNVGRLGQLQGFPHFTDGGYFEASCANKANQAYYFFWLLSLTSIQRLLFEACVVTNYGVLLLITFIVIFQL